MLNDSPTERLAPSPLPLLLVVDDDPEITFLYRALFGKHFRLIVASDGEEGLQQALAAAPDLILTDQNMPNCTGVEMVERLRQIPALRQIPIIVSSAYLNAKLEQQFTALGIVHFLDKPCLGQELLQIASVQLSKGRSLGTAPAQVSLAHG